MLRAAGMAAGVILIGLLAAFAFLDRMRDREILERTYATYQEAVADGLFQRGWIPNVIPASAVRIVEIHDLDTNARCARLELDPTDESALLMSLVRVGFSRADTAPAVPGKFSNSKTCPFDSDSIETARAVFSRPGITSKETEYFAVGGQPPVVYYWSLYGDRAD